MNAREQARFDGLKGASTFGLNHADDFKPVAPATLPTKAQTLFAALGTVADGDLATEKDTVIGNLVRKTADQQSGTGDFRGGATSKSVKRDGLLAELKKINRSAAAVADAQNKPEIMDNFRMPHETNDTETAARARAFADAAEALKGEFIALAHPADFIESLRARVAKFEEADGSKKAGLQDQVGATKSIDELLGDGLTILKQLDAIMHNLYDGDPAMLATWLSASNIQRPSSAPAKPTPTPAPTPTP